jgi:non-specific serine/threonine protein kinase
VDQPLVTAVCLEALAWIVVEEHDAADAATLMGAADTFGAAIGSSPILFPELRHHHDACQRVARQALGEEGYRTAHRRGSRFEIVRAIAFALDRTLKSKTFAPEPLLTAMELRVGELVARGLSNDAIAAELAISSSTVRGHLGRMRTKLGVNSKRQIGAWVRAQDRGSARSAISRPQM